MFTGIIECLGTILSVEKEGGNINFWVSSAISNDLKIDQSVAHNGVCLTVVGLGEDCHKVTAIKETLEKTNLHDWMINHKINLERAMVFGSRLDGHMVQGHVDCQALCTLSETQNGSWTFGFTYQPTPGLLTVSKGSICVNGVSLTVVESADRYFTVAIIPYTYNNTSFQLLKIGDRVNLEFDIMGKYFFRYQQAYASQLK